MVRRTTAIGCVLVALLCGSALARPPAATPAPASDAAGPSARFEEIGRRYLDALPRLAPEYGTTLGDHRFDGDLSDPSAAGRARQLAVERGLLAELAKIDRAKLSRDAQVDAALLDNQIRQDIWTIETLQRWAWDPQLYNDAAGAALYGLAARDFAPWPVRLKAATLRMEKLPAYLAAARTQLDVARVPLVMAQSVAKRNAGLVDIAQGMLAPHASELAPTDRARFDAALAGLKQASAEHQHWLDTVLVPGAKGDFRLGAARYDQAMRFALMSTLSRADLEARAHAAMADTRAQMYALARTALSGRADAPPLPADPSADQQQHAITAALALSYAQRPARDALMATAKADLDRATAFVRAHDLVGMPDAPVRIITMPKFQQGTAVAYDDPPGALETSGANFFAISPIPDDWTDAQATSFLSEYNDFMVHDLVVHEAMPGHYLQLFHQNQSKNVLRAVLSSGPFVEGWAVYAEGMMADEGFVDGNVLFKLTVLKMRLRSIANTLLDIGIQTEGMTREQAMTLMMQGAFQQEREAAGKWTRAQLSAVQLLSYFSGYAEHQALREEAMKRWGSGYTLRRYNDAVLAHGAPPVRFVRQLMFGLPIG
ncbi:DUF885 domain-containing protein [Sphingomonas sp. TREG-RG-20F-R18-01]|uniref:DUF885 domain-containing protein n=1 Tax=Sphingomonas sp. TREG-RG-20F-R18-01 TaxID=2914982 RepID=UPI001F5A5310|nr:DUF885 domain-containing protein [Sphingomonas sp. TREG-RG-20F-R18-01]